MTIISSAFNELINICNAAKFHKTYCSEPNCGVALYTLKQTAARLALIVREHEKSEAYQLIDSTDWT